MGIYLSCLSCNVLQLYYLNRTRTLNYDDKLTTCFIDLLNFKGAKIWMID
jgi:hypothetical protein